MPHTYSPLHPVPPSPFIIVITNGMRKECKKMHSQHKKHLQSYSNDPHIFSSTATDIRSTIKSHPTTFSAVADALLLRLGEFIHIRRMYHLTTATYTNFQFHQLHQPHANSPLHKIAHFCSPQTLNHATGLEGCLMTATSV
jgi:hypothetical protein